MSIEIITIALKAEIERFLLMEDDQINFILQEPNVTLKERLGTIEDLQVIIYSREHNPPHFHVISKDKRIDAKFSISDCSLLEGNVNRVQMKKILAFHGSVKGRILMEVIWKQKNVKQ